MSEQAKALAHDILYTYFGVDDPKDDAVAGAAAMIDAVFCPPCPDCGADWKPRAQWKCGSWSEPPARQISVKCVQRQLAEFDTANEKLTAENALLRSTWTPPADAEAPTTVDPHDGPAVADMADGLPDSGHREPPDAMR